MTDDGALELLVARIEAPGHNGGSSSIPSDVTGELARLLQWWRAVGSTVVPVAAHPRPSAAASSFDDGISAAERAIDGGASLLVAPADTPDEIAARAAVSLLARRDPSAVVYQRPAMADAEWMAVVAGVRDRSASCAQLRGEPLALARSLDDGRIAWTVGMLLASAARRTPCLIDGTSAWAAALVADRLCHRAHGWWRPGSTSSDPARDAAMDRVDLRDALPLGLTDDAGRGASATLDLLRSVAEPPG